MQTSTVLPTSVPFFSLEKIPLPYRKIITQLLSVLIHGPFTLYFSYLMMYLKQSLYNWSLFFHRSTSLLLSTAACADYPWPRFATGGKTLFPITKSSHSV